MKHIITIIFSVLFVTSFFFTSIGRCEVKKYHSLARALKEPVKVYHLDLSNQKLDSLPDKLSELKKRP